MSTKLKLTAVFEEDEEGGYIAFIEELPGVNTQGESLEEARANLQEAFELVMNTRLIEKSVINDVLAKIFPDVEFVESDADLDHAGDIDYIGKVGNKAFGIQVKPITANANFGNYKPSERMQANFTAFEEKYGGQVFIIFSAKVKNKKEIQNKEIIQEIREEIKRLSLLP